MSDKPDLAEKIGTAINELDIDFSRFTIAGWILSLLSLGTGGGVAYWTCSVMVRRNGLNLAAGMTFCLTMIAVTTIVFLVSSYIAATRLAIFVGLPAFLIALPGR